jgi:hypothetical protein
VLGGCPSTERLAARAAGPASKLVGGRTQSSKKNNTAAPTGRDKNSCSFLVFLPAQRAVKKTIAISWLFVSEALTARTRSSVSTAHPKHFWCLC